jgi:DNA-binding NarL/FixJ family response regulator
MINVLIADDHKIVRDGLKSILMQHPVEVTVTGEAASGTEVLALLEVVAADLVLMDIDMPELNGIETTRQIRERFPAVKVVMLTMTDNEQLVRESMQAGAQGYLLKSGGHKELLHAIHSVAEGEEYFSVELTKILLQRVQSPRPVQAVGGAVPEQLPVQISVRELEVLRLIAKGHTNNQIGEILFTSRRTVETHRQYLLEKTGANNTATLILYAAAHNLLD